MIPAFAGALKIFLIIVAALVLPILTVYLAVKLFQGLAWTLSRVSRGVGAFFRHLGCFVRGMVVDTLHFVGAVLTAALITPLALLNLSLARWSTAAHYARAMEDELSSAALSCYRVLLGHPLRLVCLHLITDGLEQRIPDLVAREPGSTRKQSGFEGYKLTGTLPAGGSGALLYLAKPRPEKEAALRAAGHHLSPEVVIKSFALGAGSTLPQIVRESRALEAASRLGLVYEHRLDESSFYYVMPYVPGDDLNRSIDRMHGRGGSAGLGSKDMRRAISYGSDLLATLARFHEGGLWHKDIKPSNLIVCEERVHLVDLGLVTPLASAMTLTTHGTEYYRDPEMVRLALQGVKVHEVDGAKFDLYSAGAVLYSLIENSFPAHGSLSRITKRCPDALQWVIRRAMADMKDRYGSADEMLQDLSALAAARDPYKLKPAQLPSMGGARADAHFSEPDPRIYGTPSQRVAPAAHRARAGRPVPLAPVQSGERRRRRSLTRVAVAVSLWLALVVGAVLAMRTIGDDGHSGRHGSVWPRGVPGSYDLARGDTSARSFESRWARRLRSELPARTARTGAGTVLLLEDLGPEVDTDVLRGLQAALEAVDYEVLGTDWGTPEDERDILYAAGARRVVGLSRPTDEEAVRRLQTYLAESPGLDAIVWLAESGDNAEPYYRVVLPVEGARVLEGATMSGGVIDYGVQR